MTDAGESEAGTELEVLAAPAQWSGESATADRGLAIGREREIADVAAAR